MSTPRAKSRVKESKMKVPTHNSLHIREAQPDDVPPLLAMVRELAEFERLSHQVVATEADYHRSLFGPQSCASALIAEVQDERVGYAIYFTTFSTFLGRGGIWLEDLYVRPAYRGQGYGTALVRAVARIAASREAGRLEWSVLDWNQRAIDLYEQLGGELLQEWRIVRLEGARLERLADHRPEAPREARGEGA